MAREWLLRGVDPEELKPTPKDEGPQTPRSKWENFWYHHKLKFWLITFAVVVLIILVVQIIRRDDPDYRVLFITEQPYLDKELDELASYLEQFGDDLDGDGKVEVRVQNCCINADQSRNSGIQQIQAHLINGDRLFFVWDPEAYEFFKTTVLDESDAGMDFLATITEQDAGLIEEGKVWSWSEDSSRTEALKERWPDLYFGVRAGKEDSSECLALLEALIADESLNQ